ncbi:Ig-like domain-containing protein [Spirochaeta dissipatitropha]
MSKVVFRSDKQTTRDCGNSLLVLMYMISLLLISTLPVFGRGTPEDAWQPVEGTENWQHELDISEYDAGLYNIIIQGRDFAGNEYIEGPFNIRIDPESDKPITRIIYPEPGSVVRGTVDVVGVAVDDDAVGRVEVRLNDGAWRRVDEGTDYWRYQVPANLLDDGLHTIESRAIDINGLEGDVYRTRFLLDTRPPVIRISSHENGSIVNGRVRFEGRVQDENGIQLLELSRDSRQSWETVRTRSQRGEIYEEFQFDVRTDRQDDGAVIYWLRATDATGSRSEVAFLFFIDNESPDITVFEPESGSDVYGFVSIAGAIRDEVGVERFWWNWDGQEEEIELIPGNPYWDIEIDTRAYRGRNIDVNFYAEDTSGNRTHVRHRLANNQDAAKPVVSVQSPLFTGEDAVSSVPFASTLYGQVEGVHRADFVEVQGLGSEPLRIPAYPAFSISLEEAPVGRLDLRLTPVDELGYRGEELRLRFTHKADSPEISLQQLSYSGGSSEAYLSGMPYDRLIPAEVSGTVYSRGAISSVAVRLGEGDSAQILRVRSRRGDVRNDGKRAEEFSFELPRSGLFGLIPIVITAVDEFGTENRIQKYLDYRDTRRIEVDPFIWTDDERLSGSGIIELSGRNSLQFRLIGSNGGSGDSFRNVRMEPETDILVLRNQADIVSITGQRDGLVENVIIHAEATGRDGQIISLSSGPYTIRVDRQKPLINLDRPESGFVAGSSLSVSGSIENASDIRRSEISVDGGRTWEALTLRRSGDGFSFTNAFTFGEGDPTEHAIIVRAWDVHGNHGEERRIVTRSPELPLPSGEEAEGRRNDQPELQVMFPRAGAVVDGAVQIGGVVRDLDGTSQIEYSVNGSEFRRGQSFDSRRYNQVFMFSITGLEPGQHDVVIRATDRHPEPRTREQRVRFVLASPMIEIGQLSSNGQELQQGFQQNLGQRRDISGIVHNAERLATLRWRINDGSWNNLRFQAADSPAYARTYSFQLPDSLAYGRHVLEVQAEDSEGHIVSRKIGFSVLSEGSAPVYSNQLIFLDPVISRSEMVIMDRRFLSAVFVGRPMAAVEQVGAEHLFRTSFEKNRIEVTPTGQGREDDLRFKITTIDGLTYESASYTVVVDYEYPEFVLSGPNAGFYSSGTTAIEGVLRDEVGLDGLYYRIGLNGSYRKIESPWLVDSSAETDAEAETVSETDTETDAPDSSMDRVQDEFYYEISLAARSHGAQHIFLQGRDSMGRVVEHWLPVVYDPLPASVHFVSPPAQDVINGLTRVVARIDSISPIDSISYSTDSENYTPLPLSSTIDHMVDFSLLTQEDEELVFRIVDVAGNIAHVSPIVEVSLEDDLPVVEIQIPEENAVIDSDFRLSGMAFDDDAVRDIFWRIRYTGDDGQEVEDDEVVSEETVSDAGEADEADSSIEEAVQIEEIPWQRLPGGNSFSVDIPLSDLADNEHLIEVYAVDYYGLPGEIVSRNIRVSLQEPEIYMDLPLVDETNKGMIRLEGRAFDENGIAEVLLSFDNGNSFQRASTSTGDFSEWHYDLNSTIFEDGTYSVQVVAVDTYGIPAQFFTLINIDNTAPVINVTLPNDNDVVSQEFLLNSRVADNIGVVSYVLEIDPVSHEGESRLIELPLDPVLRQRIDISDLSEGWYNLRLTARDAADNETVVARNVLVQDDLESSFVSLLFPQAGADKVGPVVVEGLARSTVPLRRVQLLLNGSLLDTTTVNSRGYFRYEIPQDEVQNGYNELQAVIQPGAGEQVSSSIIGFQYTSLGPFVTLESHQVGDFITDRPWISGTAGYNHNLNDDDPEYRRKSRELRVSRVEVSLDNGRTFETARGGQEWRYRIETGDYPDGPLAVIVRARFENGESAVTRSMFTLDQQPPQIDLLSPHEDARLNTRIRMEGTASDEHGIESIKVALRPGDKSSYAVPGFIQGMYLDAHVLGVTYFQIGLGFSFFDDNVKLQGQYGLGPEEALDDEGIMRPARFSGHFLGGKLLANVASLPFNTFFGPDWEFLSLNVALGATFNYIRLFEPLIPAGRGPEDAIDSVVLSAIVGQLEFPRIQLNHLTFFNAYAFYVEPQVWFIPSDASPDIVPRLSFGARVQLF